MLTPQAHAFNISTKAIALTGDNAPAANMPFTSFLDGSINDKGAIAFSASYTDPGALGFANGVFLNDTTGLSSIVISGQTFNSGPFNAETFSINNIKPDINNDGTVVFNTRSIYRFSNGTLTQLTPSSGSIAGTFFASGSSTPSINNNGQIAFEVTEFRNSALEDSIFRINGTTVTNAVHGSDAAPGGGTYGNIRFNFFIGLNDNGQIAFASPNGGGSSPNAAYFVDEFNTPSLIVKQGDAAPDTGGGTVGDFMNLVSLNNSGHVVISTSIAGGNTTFALYRSTDTTPVQITAIGKPLFTGTTEFFSSGKINNLDDVAFDADTVVDGQFHLGTFVSLNDGSVLPVFTPGRKLNVAAGDSRTIASSRTLDFNSAGQILAEVVFTDGSRGLFTANTRNVAAKLTTGSPVSITQSVTVPAPAASSFTLAFDYQFVTGSGSLTVDLGFINGLIQITGGGTPMDSFAHFENTFNFPLGNPGDLVDLTFTFNDSQSGSVLLLDNVSLPGLVNGDFSDGYESFVISGPGHADLTGLEALDPAPVPEPSALLGLLALAAPLRLRRRA
ncbi:MAG: hypothetical protein GC162_01105 [Planctomycetes bacterium]|nr:hypothetical protein [Planctomycetota bacterium]